LHRALRKNAGAPMQKVTISPVRFRGARSLLVVALVAMFASVAMDVQAANPLKPKKKADEVTPAPPAAPAPLAPAASKPTTATPSPTKPADVAPAKAPEKPVQPEKPAPAAEVEATPVDVPGPAVRKPVKRAEDDLPSEEPKLRGGKKGAWQGFFVNFNVGYATAGGTDGPTIPEPNGISSGLIPLRISDRERYNAAVTTNRGAGLAACLQIGYNIMGFVSLWFDASWHGTLAGGADAAGNGTAAGILGLHPLRFVAPDLPGDITLYGGYGFFDLLYYYEVAFDSQNPSGKSWMGTSIPFGLSAEYRLDPAGAFTLGFDMRIVSASYNEWVYNYDKNYISRPQTPQTTLRYEPRLMLGGHF